ncbi:MAG TPA: bifunctional demethylmenaquinone methyltransferase/2-methoxy-6-polyprenyl-1,4-benzoquinol methylase UbiE [Opitutus sp.]|nr:bifunctional demethylmenaquinone methyltransferase/2-methoxy-6-polyprenyl-1,4-benzoquinol methylase UbiE [Opitutus sp.]
MPDPVAVSSMFARIARHYDLANRLLSFGLDRSWRARLVAAVARRRPHDVLDLATGSGDVAFALASRLPSSVHITGADFCQPMLDEAERKRADLGPFPNLLFRPADALALPFADHSFDAITIAFGLRNLADRPRALGEMRRVLRRGGHLFILEFSQPPRWFRPFYFCYLRHLLPRLAGLVTGDRAAYAYLNESIERFPAREALSAELRSAGFAAIEAFPLAQGAVALHVAAR